MNLQATGDEGGKKPNSIGELINAVFKNMWKISRKKIICSVFMSAGIFVINIIISLVFCETTNNFLNGMMVRRGNMLSGSVFWSLLGVNILNITDMLKGSDGFSVFSNLKQVIYGIINSTKNTHKRNYAIGIIFAGIVFIILGNPALSFVTSLTFIVSLLKGKRSRLINILSLFKLKKSREKHSSGEIINQLTSALNGSTFSMLIFTVLGGLNFGKGLYTVVLVLVIAIIFIFGRKNNTKSMMLISIILCFILYGALFINVQGFDVQEEYQKYERHFRIGFEHVSTEELMTTYADRVVNSILEEIQDNKNNSKLKDNDSYDLVFTERLQNEAINLIKEKRNVGITKEKFIDLSFGDNLKKVYSFQIFEAYELLREIAIRLEEENKNRQIDNDFVSPDNRTDFEKDKNSEEKNKGSFNDSTEVIDSIDIVIGSVFAGILSLLCMLLFQNLSGLNLRGGSGTNSSDKKTTTDKEILDAWNKANKNSDTSIITDSDVTEYEKSMQDPKEYVPKENKTMDKTIFPPNIQDISTNQKENENDKENDKNHKYKLEYYMDKATLSPGNIEEYITVYARVVDSSEDGKYAEIAASMTDSLRLECFDSKYKEYIYIKKEINAQWEGYTSFYVYFTYTSNKDNEFDFEKDFRISLELVGTEDTTPESNTLDIRITKGESKIIIDPYEIVVPENSQKHAPIKAKVKTFLKGEWQFTSEIDRGLECAIEQVRCESESSNSCIISVSSTIIEEGAGKYITNEVKIIAQNIKTKTKIERTMTVTVAQEGLILISPRPVRVLPEGVGESKFKLTAIYSKDGQMDTDLGLLNSITFDNEIKTDSDIVKKAFETAKLDFSGEKVRYPMDTGEDLTYFEYTVKCKNSVPGDGENLYGHIIARGKKEGKEYKLLIPIMLDLTSLGPKSEYWQEELKKCIQVVKMLPIEHQERFHKLLKEKAFVLGAPGLYDLRWRIYRIAQTLWQAKGGEGYESVSEWGDYLEKFRVLNSVTNFVCRIVLEILTAKQLSGVVGGIKGAFAAMTVGEVYDLITKTLNYVLWDEDKSLDEYIETIFTSNLQNIIQDLGAEAIDPDTLSKYFKTNLRMKAASYIILFIYLWTTNIKIKKMSAIEAAKQATMRLGMKEVIKFVTTNFGKYYDVDHFSKLGRKAAKEKIDNLSKAVEIGDTEAIRKNILDVQSDKFALAEINKLDANGNPVYPVKVRKAMNDTIEEMIKRPTWKSLKSKIKNFYESQGFKVENIELASGSNKSEFVKVGSDWDVGVKVKLTAKSGADIPVKQMRQKDLKPLLEESLYDSVEAKYRKGLNPEQFAKKLDVAAMSDDASGGFGKEWKKVLDVKKNLADKKELGLKDPDSVGFTSKDKVLEWSNEAREYSEKFKKLGGDTNMVKYEEKMLEALKQLKKANNNLLGPMHKAAKEMGKNINDIPSIINDTSKLSDRVINGEISAKYLEKLLKKKGYTFEQVVNMSGSLISEYAKMHS